MSIEVPVGRSASVVIPDAELRVRFSRSSGPGGQNVNKTDSRVELTVRVLGSRNIPGYLQRRAKERLSSRLVDGAITVSASANRSQLQNRQAAEARMLEVLTAAFAPPAPPRRKTRPTRSSQEKRLQAKKQRGDTKRMRRPVDD